MKHAPPAGLGKAGADLWRAVLGEFDLEPHELRLLLEACRTADELERLSEALPGAELVVAGSKGQPRPSPLLAEVRQHRAILARLLAALDVTG